MPEGVTVADAGISYLISEQHQLDRLETSADAAVGLTNDPSVMLPTSQLGAPTLL
jgi:hypothetical protein